MRNLYVLFLVTLVSFVPTHARAGAWLQNENDGQIITTFRYYSTDTFFTPDGSKTKIPDFSKTEINPYFEYGLRNWITIGGDLDLASVSNDTPHLKDITDTKINSGSIFARAYLYHQGNYVVSLEPGIDFPSSIGSDLTSDGSKPIPELKLNFGYGFAMNGRNHFFDASLKYRKRSDGGLDDMVKGEATLGYKLSDDFTALAQLSQEETLGPVDKGISGNYNLTKPQLSVLYDYSKSFSHQLGVFSDIYGQNVGAGYGVTYSVWYKF